MDTDLTAANGKKVKALEIFAYALQYFKEQALKVRTGADVSHKGARQPGGSVFLGVRMAQMVLGRTGNGAESFQCMGKAPPAGGGLGSISS